MRRWLVRLILVSPWLALALLGLSIAAPAELFPPIAGQQVAVK